MTKLRYAVIDKRDGYSFKAFYGRSKAYAYAVYLNSLNHTIKPYRVVTLSKLAELDRLK
jgi:predicted phosphoadenosine phosphosulfate sulfurtransferase